MPVAYGMVGGVKHAGNAEAGNTPLEARQEPPRPRGTFHRSIPAGKAKCASCGVETPSRELKGGACRTCRDNASLPILARRMRKAEEMAGLKAKQAAALAGIGYGSYLRYRDGSVEPTASRVAAICQALGVSADWLLGVGR